MNQPTENEEIIHTKTSKPWGGIVLSLIIIGLIAFYITIFKPTTLNESIFKSDVVTARKTATQSDKAVMMIFSASWCGPCIQMKKETWSDPQVVDLLDQSVVPVYVDTDTDQGRKWANDYGVASLPTIIVSRPDGKVLQWHTGYMSNAETRTLLEEYRGGIQDHGG